MTDPVGIEMDELRLPRTMASRYPDHRYLMAGLRVGRRLLLHRVPILPYLVRLLLRWIFSTDVPLKVHIPPGVIFMHNGLGTVIHDATVFRGPAIIFHHVTLGNSLGRNPGAPQIGSCVLIGAGAAILGAVEVGDCSIVGANAVVLHDVPPLHTAVGNPARCTPLDGSHVERFFGVSAQSVLARRAREGPHPISPPSPPSGEPSPRPA